MPSWPFVAAWHEDRLEVLDVAVVANEISGGTVSCGTEVGRVDQEAFGSAVHFQGKYGNRRIGYVFEGVADPPVHTFNMPE